MIKFKFMYVKKMGQDISTEQRRELTKQVLAIAQEDTQRAAGRQRAEFKSEQDELLPYKDYRYIITGPISLSMQTSDLYQKTIFVFGEKHTLSGICHNVYYHKKIAIEDFLDNTLVANPSKVIDIFLEYPHYSNDNSGHRMTTGNIDRIAKKFKDCALRQSGTCPKNVRVHNVDVRQTLLTETKETTGSGGFGEAKETTGFGGFGETKETKETAPLVTMGRLIDEFSWLSDAETWKDNDYVLKLVDDAQQRIKYLFTLQINSSDEISFELGFEQTKVLKQIGYLPKDLQRLLLTYFIGISKEYGLKWSDLISAFEALENIKTNFRAVSVTKSTAILQTVADKIVDYAVSYVDMYIIARMFRVFSDGTSAKNIIIYAGDYHAEIIRRFLELIGFNMDFFRYSQDGCVGSDAPSLWL